jgi:hypothetical protein
MIILPAMVGTPEMNMSRRLLRAKLLRQSRDKKQGEERDREREQRQVLDIDKWLGLFSFTVKLVSKIMRAF